eukprot:g63666.t1
MPHAHSYLVCRTQASAPEGNNTTHSLHKEFHNQSVRRSKQLLTSAMSGQELAQEAENGNLQRVKVLLAQGVSADSKGSDGFPALVIAGAKGHTAVAEALLTARANVHATDPRGNTALHWVVLNGNTETAQALLAAGAHTEAKNNDEMTALDLLFADEETPKLLEEAAKVKHVVSRAERGELTAADKSSLDSATEAEYWTPLLFATARGLQTAVQNILDIKASVDKPNKANATALMLAAQYGHTEVGRLLLARKADVNATDQHGDTAFHLALRHGHFPTAEVLVAAGGDITARNKEGEGMHGYIRGNAGLLQACEKHQAAALLVVAASEGDTELGRRLVDGKAELNATDQVIAAANDKAKVS